MSTANLPLEPVHPLSVHIPAPHLFLDSPHRNASIRTDPGRPTVRPLPRPPHPSNTDSAGARPVPRRRVSGGCFVHLPPPAVKIKKAPVFFVCNPSDSPISPNSPEFRSSHSAPLLQPNLPINIIPATPMPPHTPGLVHSHTTTHLAPPSKLDSPASDSSPITIHHQRRTTKMHRRFGGSVGSIPASALADLRCLGEGNGPSQKPFGFPSRSNTIAVHVTKDEDSDSSSSEEDDDEEAYSWVVETATRVTRTEPRVSLKWTEDLGGDRWIADHYSAILRAL
ncbi:hypothetical protein MVEN_00752500 [Mycena venus]|uniref:Uncharacterized protein n=1 Tax=Mycena venus TaxID=2733690 RepID=A0A8H7D5N1_9AGAR|nr:hypothetical protein MVEN_00752500 [Mycena venus]